MIKSKSHAEQDLSLKPDETILSQGRIGLGIYWPTVAVAILSLLIAVVVHPNLGGFLLMVAILMFVIAYMRRLVTIVVVTNQRVHIRQGIFMTESVQLRLEQIESVEIFRTPVGMALGYGMLVVTGTGGRNTIVPYLDNVADVRQAIDEGVQGDAARSHAV
ncbi:MAG: PH domain-containing protein [Pseudomonadota bacterium]